MMRWAGGAMEHIRLFDSTLRWYGFDRSAVMFIVGDNTATNPAIARNFRLWDPKTATK
jgi:hypothetical protein